MSDQVTANIVDDKLETVDQFCEAVGCGRTTFYELLKSKRIRAVKLGASTRVRKSERLKFIASLPSVGTTDAAA